MVRASDFLVALGINRTDDDDRPSADAIDRRDVAAARTDTSWMEYMMDGWCAVELGRWGLWPAVYRLFACAAVRLG
jgi:hypothetical protein